MYKNNIYNSKKKENENNKNNEKIDKIKKKKNKKVLRHPIEKKHFDFLMDKIEELETDEKVKFNKKLMNALMYFTGMRINEALLLDKNNIEELFTGGIYNLYCKKTYSYRFIYMQKDLLDNFMSYFKTGFEVDDKGLINKWGNKLNFLTAERWMAPYFKLLNEKFGGNVKILKGNAWGLHSYRINFINQIIRAENIDIASRMIGHTSIITTCGYYRKMEIPPEKIREVFRKAIF